MTTDTTPCTVAAMIHNGRLFIDSDGDICIARSGDNLVAGAAYATFDVSAAQLNLDVFEEMVERFNAFPALAAERDRLKAWVEKNGADVDAAVAERTEELTAERDRLAAENERLAAALERVASMAPHHLGQTPHEYHMQQIARAALKGETP